VTTTGRSRAATIRLVGGRPCLDLANTVSWRSVPERREEHLLELDDALTWCVRAGVLEGAEADRLRRDLAGHPRRARSLLEGIRGVRDQVWGYVVDVDEPDVAALSPLIASTLAHCTLRAEGDAARWTVTSLDEHTPTRRLVLDLADLLTRPVGRIGRCSDPACGWAFVDTSRGRNRRWCSSADCGNRYRVRRHQARTR